MKKPEQNITEYNSKKLYIDEIYPKIVEIKKICKINRIPFFFSCAPINENGNTVYENEAVLTGSNDIVLFKDLFKKYILLLRGAQIQPLSAVKDLDPDAVNYIGDIEELIEENEDYLGDL